MPGKLNLLSAQVDGFRFTQPILRALLLIFAVFFAPLAHAQERAAFKLETGPEAFIHIAHRAAKAQHGVLFGGLIGAPADEIRVFVGFEVGEAHDYRLGSEGGGNLGDTLGEFFNVEADRVRIARHLHADLFLQFAIKSMAFRNSHS